MPTALTRKSPSCDTPQLRALGPLMDTGLPVTRWYNGLIKLGTLLDSACCLLLPPGTPLTGYSELTLYSSLSCRYDSKAMTAVSCSTHVVPPSCWLAEVAPAPGSVGRGP
jgi:hypothetical protein